MITDRATAKILGLVVFILAVLIVVTCFVFSGTEARQNPRFPILVLISSLPMFVVSLLLFLKASSMKPDDPDDD